jgi:hypothetical protein
MALNSNNNGQRSRFDYEKFTGSRISFVAEMKRREMLFSKLCNVGYIVGGWLLVKDDPPFLK